MDNKKYAKELFAVEVVIGYRIVVGAFWQNSLYDLSKMP